MTAWAHDPTTAGSGLWNSHSITVRRGVAGLADGGDFALGRGVGAGRGSASRASNSFRAARRKPRAGYQSAQAGKALSPTTLADEHARNQAPLSGIPRRPDAATRRQAMAAGRTIAAAVAWRSELWRRRRRIPQLRRSVEAGSLRRHGAESGPSVRPTGRGPDASVCVRNAEYLTPGNRSLTFAALIAGIKSRERKRAVPVHILRISDATTASR